MRIVIAGGTGFLGSALVDELSRAGASVSVLTRRPTESHHVQWDPNGPATGWTHALDGADAVIGVTGAPIDRRWTQSYKRELWNSRVVVTRNLVAALTSVRQVPKVFISTSGVGIYGPHGDEPVTEETPAGSGFLATLSAAWEGEARAAEPHTRVVVLRNGVVLDRRGGALPKMALPFSFFAGGWLGSGRQYLPWIHKDDWTGMVRWALLNGAVAGPLNVTAPDPVTNKAFSQTLGRVLGRPALFSAPAFALRLVLGEMADAVLTGQRVLPAKAQSLGFEFRYPTLENALRAIYST